MIQKFQRNSSAVAGRAQLFHRGDLVYVANQTGSRSHFTGGCEALVDGSYNDICSPHRYEGGSSRYGLFLFTSKGIRRISWYDEEDLRLRKTRTLTDIEWAERLARGEQ